MPGRLDRSDYVWLFKELPGELDSGDDLASNDRNPLVMALRQHGLCWWRYYEFPFSHHVAALCCLMNWKEALNDAAAKANPTKAFLEFAKVDLAGDHNCGLDKSPEEISLVFNLLIGLVYSLESISIFGLSINELLEKARSGEIRALRDAINIDKTVIATNTGAAVIALAQLRDDNRTLKSLFKRKKPHDRRQIHLDLRFMRRVFAEAGALDRGVTDALIKFITDDLKAYSTVGGDAGKNIRQLFDGFRKEAAI